MHAPDYFDSLEIPPDRRNGRRQKAEDVESYLISHLLSRPQSRPSEEENTAASLKHFFSLEADPYNHNDSMDVIAAQVAALDGKIEIGEERCSRNIGGDVCVTYQRDYRAS